MNLQTFENNPEYYIISANGSLHKENISKNFSESICLKDFLSKDEIQYFTEQGFQSQPNLTIVPNGQCVIYGNLYPLFEKIKARLCDHLGAEYGNSPAVGGHYVITPCGAGTHNDGIKEHRWYDSLNTVSENDPQRKYVSWKSVLLPLWAYGHSNTGGHLTLFNERANNFAAGSPKSVFYKPVDPNKSIEYLDINANYVDTSYDRLDPRVYENYIDQSYDSVKGFTVENIFEWCPGDVIIFDSTQIHCSSQFDKIHNTPFFANKMALLFTLIKEIED